MSITAPGHGRRHEPKIKPEFLTGYVHGLKGFVQAIDTARHKDFLSDPREFVSILATGVTRFNMKASDLASDLSVSKGATSKWVNGEALPNRVTQAAVVDWVYQHATAEISKLESEIELAS